MIGTLRRHQKWLWGVIIIATILSFTVYLSPTQRYGALSGSHGSSGPDLGSINGEPVTPEQLVAAEKEATLFYRLRSGGWPENEQQKKQIQRIAEESLVIQSLLKDYHIDPTTDAAARFTKQMFGVPPGQPMPADKLSDWVRNELTAKGGLTLDDFDRFVRHQAGQEYLISLFGMTGKLITPKEAEFFYRRENQPMATEIVSFPTSNFYRAGEPSNAELTNYFTKHEAEYRLPDRIQINHVAFYPSNYMARADKLLGTNLDDKADEIYLQQGPDAFKNEFGQPMSATGAKAKIKDQLRQYAEVQEARKDANAFLSELSQGHDETHPYAPSDLMKLAKTKGLTVKTTGLFDEKNGSPDLDLPPKAVHFLFSLRGDAPDDPEKSMLYAPSPLIDQSQTAVYIAGLEKRIASQLQLISAVRDQVVKDYRESKAMDLAKETGEKFAGALQAGLTQGKSFDAVCAVQNVKPERLAPFALTSTNVPPELDKTSFQQLEEAAFPLPTGQSSKFIPTADGGMVAYVKARLPVDEARMKQQLPVFLDRMREQRQIAAFQEWLGRQMQLRWIPPPAEQSSAG